MKKEKLTRIKQSAATLITTTSKRIKTKLKRLTQIEYRKLVLS